MLLNILHRLTIYDMRLNITGQFLFFYFHQTNNTV